MATFLSIHRVEFCWHFSSSCFQKSFYSPLASSVLMFNSSFWGLMHYQCSHTCGLGTRKRSVFCVHATSNDVVSPVYCKDKRKPRDSRECRRAPCPHEWVGEEWSQVRSDDWLVIHSIIIHCLLFLQHLIVFYRILFQSSFLELFFLSFYFIQSM